MKVSELAALCGMSFVLMTSAHAQGAVVINELKPSEDPAKVVLTTTEQQLMDTAVLPKARKILAADGCEEFIDIASRVQGSFTKTGSKQTLIFYQFCQTGNGFGSAGVAVIERTRVVGNFVSQSSGWTQEARTLPDINQNGIDEVALYYSGGMHQGAGGTGVEIMEVSGGVLKGIGWFQAEGFSETGPVFGYKVTVTPAKLPMYFRQKYIQNSKGKWGQPGKIVPLKLGKVNSEFEAVN
jgi:hypothetical protein